MFFKKFVIHAHKSAMMQTAFKNALKVNPFHMCLHQTKMFKDFRTTWTFVERNFWLMHIFNVTLKVFLGEKIRAAVWQEITFNCDWFVVYVDMGPDFLVWQKFTTIYALQFIRLVSFVAFTDMLLQISLGFKVKTALVAIFALNHFPLVFFSNVAP
jgi:hypothetical protein